MAIFSGIDHAGLTVTDLDRSERFYTRVLGFVRFIDGGYARIFFEPQTTFVLTLATHESAQGGQFSELNTGLDHLGLAVGSLTELKQWERLLEEAQVEFTPIRDMEFGYHLNFRDPDGIALELMAPKKNWTTLRDMMHSGATAEQVGEAARRAMRVLEGDRAPRSVPTRRILK